MFICIALAIVLRQTQRLLFQKLKHLDIRQPGRADGQTETETGRRRDDWMFPSPVGPARPPAIPNTDSSSGVANACRRAVRIGC